MTDKEVLTVCYLIVLHLIISVLYYAAIVTVTTSLLAGAISWFAGDKIENETKGTIKGTKMSDLDFDTTEVMEETEEI